VQTAGGQRMTQTGLSLGTPQYMSPEQAMGERTIDARSDIYSLAAVAYEMLIGEAPFTGPTVQAIVARVMSEDPRPLMPQRKSIPDHVDYAIMRGLEKLPADRWPSAHDFAESLKGNTISATVRTSSARKASVKRSAGFSSRMRDLLVLALGAIALASIGIAVWAQRNRPTTTKDVVRFAIPAVESSHSNSLGQNTLAVSPDGRTFVYVGKREDGTEQLMVRKLDDITARPLPETENGTSPLFSPDGKSIAFIRSNQIFRLSLDANRAQLLGAVPGTFAGASWSSAGYIILSGNIGLYLLPDGGGVARQFSKSDTAQSEIYQDAPLVLDKEKTVVYASWRNSGISDVRLAMTSLETGKSTVFDVPGVNPLGIIDGVLVYVTAAGTVNGIRIDAAKRKLIGPPVQIMSGLAVNAVSGLARASLSHSGTLFYQSETQLSKLVIASRSGAPRVVIDQPGEYAFPRLSPDGKHIALTINTGDRNDIWIYELGSGTMTRLTTDGHANDRPEWTPDGKYVLFRSDRAQSEIWWRPADLSAPSSQLLAGPRLALFEAVMSPDSRNIAYQIDTLGADLYYRGTGSDKTVKVISNNPSAIETMPRISPDGRWIAFTTDESGAVEVVIQPFPGPGGRVQVSTGGGTEPVWSRDGRQIFYRTNAGFMAARIRPGPTLSIEARDTLLADDYVYASNPHANYDVMPDGEHFLFLKPASSGNLVVAANWRSVLAARMAESTSH
jgi:serine/threonine-protein kinase